METSKQSTGETLFDLTSYVAATHASRSATQGNGEAKKTPGTCGLGYETPLAHFDPNTASWRMCEDTLALVEPPLLETLPPSAMTRNGVLYQQPAWEPITDATASLLWPTPKATLHKQTNWYLRPDGYRHNAGEIPPGWEHLSGKPMNLAWWEWLMGFPTGWTDLEHSETP